MTATSKASAAKGQRRLERYRLSLAFALLLASCESQRSTATVAAPRQSGTAVTDLPMDRGVFVSKRFGFRLPLPNGEAWKINDHGSKWLEAKAPAESSTLVVRLWRDENRMNRDKCEATARTLRKMPMRDGVDVVDSERINVPVGFDTQLDVGLLDDGKGGFHGFVMAFGGLGRRCFAYVYTTRTTGAQADQTVGDRLAEMVERSLRAMTFESDLDMVLEREAPL